MATLNLQSLFMFVGSIAFRQTGFVYVDENMMLFPSVMQLSVSDLESTALKPSVGNVIENVLGHRHAY